MSAQIQPKQVVIPAPARRQPRPLYDRAGKRTIEERTSYPTSDWGPIRRDIIERELTGALIIHFHRGKEGAVEWLAIEVISEK